MVTDVKRYGEKTGSQLKQPAMTNRQDEFLRKSFELAVGSVRSGGGPFGALITNGETVVATGQNRVVTNCDPTAHAEIQAIRAACASLHTHDLSGHTIYTSCEPCPMCLGAIYWARLDAIWYGASREDASQAGFDDSFFYEELARNIEQRKIPLKRALAGEARRVFQAWTAKPDKVPY